MSTNYNTLLYKACLMLFTASCNAVHLFNACLFSYFLPLTFALLFMQMLFVFVLCLLVVDMVCLFQILLCTIYSVFNHLFFIIFFLHHLL